MQSEKLNAVAAAVAQVCLPSGVGEASHAEGVYSFVCKEVVPERKAEYDVVFQRYMAAIAAGATDAAAIEQELHAFPMREVWREPVVCNVVTTAGKNSMLDNFLAGSAFTQTGPYMGLISSVSWTNLATTLSSLTSYSSTTGLATLATAAAHGLSPNDTPVTIASAAGTGANISALNGTFTPQAGTTGSTLVIYVGTGLTITTVTGGNVTTASGTRLSDTMASHANWTEAGSANAPTWSTPASGARGSMAWSSASGGSKSTSSSVSFTMSGPGTIQGAFIVLGSGAVTTNGSTAGTLFSAGAFATAQGVIAGNVVTVSYSASL
ncbi:hypothetical protein [Rhodoferax sp. GW822-FHT02A01]|uniref:hypothetical protein n=1 Tax=Rhodoferax sp. GW822-FHT02A01 TaxID=3141537 RepID=UPI00315CB753